MLGNAGRWLGWWRRRPRRSAAAAVWHFRVERERSAIGNVNDTIARQLCASVPEAALRAVQVAVDELLTNVLMHAVQAAGPIEVEISRTRDAVETTIIYIAAEFDPTAWQPPAAARTLATARIGGHGIELVRSLMDEFRYAHDAGRNVVRLRKRCAL
jgi:anti-sigma regulatory factor (Ser/Thr protein kinase)